MKAKLMPKRLHDTDWPVVLPRNERAGQRRWIGENKRRPSLKMCVTSIEFDQSTVTEKGKRESLCSATSVASNAKKVMLNCFQFGFDGILMAMQK